jgi:predicted aldo/keto reductase-like oxidoreductase
VQLRIAVAVLLLGLVLAYVLGGQLIHDLIEGVRRDLSMPLWKAIVPALLLIGGVIALRARFRREVCTKCGSGLPGWMAAVPATGGASTPSRRTALRALGTGAASVVALGSGFGAAIMRNRDWLEVKEKIADAKVDITAATTRDEWHGSRVQNYRRLGRTNVEVSDIAVGTGRFQGAEVARKAIERGINYFDTAPDYSEHGSELALGEALKEAQRDKLFIATKFCVANGHLRDETPVPEIIEAVNGSLQRLNTDYVDLIHIHSCDRLERLMAPNIHEAFDRLKEQGKARFLGVSTHTPNLEEVANAAIDSGRFDVMMLAYHFGMYPSFSHILEKAKAADVGIVAMKTLKGAKHENLAKFEREAGAYSQAAFRWVLSNPSVSCLVVSFPELKCVDEYLYASGESVRAADVAMLERYDELTKGDYCQPHCGLCLDSCEYDLAINDILRHRMYYRDYGWEGEGIRQYAKLENNASQCASCAAPCAGQCPIGVPIREKMMDAHRVLRLTA